MQADILFVEDEPEMVELVSLYLQKEGFTVTASPTAEAGLAVLQQQHFDLVLLDINLPGMDGFEFLQILRRERIVPVIIVSAREADEDLVMGLGIGADEFVVKPFSPKVLTARVRALLRRVRHLAPARALHRFGPYTLDKEGCLLKRGAEKVPLSIREFDVLCYLVDNAGKAATPAAIYQAVWKHSFGDITAVAVYIQRLRRKIEPQPENPCYIETVFGRGYRFNAAGQRPEV